MVSVGSEFDKRMSRINRKHARLEHGYVAVVGKDGLIITKPRPTSGGLPFKLGLGVVVGFFLFKILLISQLGPVGYEARVAQLRDGSLIEKAGAVVLQVDPLSAAAAAKLSYLTR